MIIRPACSREFVNLPNALLNDKRLSIETRGMLAYLLSKPRDWDVRPGPLSHDLSIGRTKLTRMFEEAMAAGYMARSSKQTHKENGDFGGYEYIVGMPNDVAAAVNATGEPAGPPCAARVTYLAYAHRARAPSAHPQSADAQGVRTHKDKRQIPQRRNLNITDNHKSLPQPLPERVVAEQLGEDGYTAFGRNEQANGLKFAYEHSEPFDAWLSLRGPDGMPRIDVCLAEGRLRRGSWFPTLYPPGYRRSR
jgi:hypothetical protein